MGPGKKRIGIVSIGEVDEMVPKVVAAHISSHMDLDAGIIAPMKDPVYALDPRKFQYDAGLIMEKLNDGPHAGYDKVVGVLSVDLFVPIFSYVYGEAQQGGRCAVVSTYRIGDNQRGRSGDSAVLLERTAKIAMHELGHLFDLTHCRNPRCLMHFSGDLMMLDEIQFSLCHYCRAFWRSAVIVS